MGAVAGLFVWQGEFVLGPWVGGFVGAGVGGTTPLSRASSTALN